MATQTLMKSMGPRANSSRVATRPVRLMANGHLRFLSSKVTYLFSPPGSHLPNVTFRARPAEWTQAALHRQDSCVSEGEVHSFKQMAANALVGVALAVSLCSPPEAHALVRGNTPMSSQTLSAPPVEVPADNGATAVLDYGHVLSPPVKASLESELADLQSGTGWKIRIVTGYGPNSTPTPQVLERYWGADGKTVIMSWDEFQGNVLEFYYPDDMFSTIPKNVFQELRGRFGNVYFIREEGTEASVTKVADVLSTCFVNGGCTFVPGLSEQQRLFSLVPITSGAFLSGAALRNGLSNRWAWIFLMLWTPWILGFGYYPLYIRQPEDITPLLENTAIFAAIFYFTRTAPLLANRSPEDDGAQWSDPGNLSDGGDPPTDGTTADQDKLREEVEALKTGSREDGSAAGK